MKILQVNKYGYVKGGADSVFFNVSNLLERKGHEVIQMTTDAPQNSTAFRNQRYLLSCPELRQEGLVGKIGGLVRFVWNRDAAQLVERCLEEQHPDVAHLHNIFNSFSLSILPVLKKYHVPVVISMHDTRFICPSSYFNTRPWCNDCLKNGALSCGIHKCYQDNFLYSWACTMEMLHKEKFFDYDKYIDRYLFVSYKYMTYHSVRHAYFNEKGKVLYNFLPMQQAITLNDCKGDYVLYYGRITVEKGVKTLVEVMKQLPEVRLKVAGIGPLINQLSGEKLPNVEFVGFKHGQELYQLISHASFVIVPSEWEENNPMTIIEAYSFGKPVVGSAIGGIPEIIEDGKTGFLFDAFSRDSLTESIKKAIKVSPEEYATMSHNARMFAEKHFSPDSYYTHLMDVYKQVIRK